MTLREIYRLSHRELTAYRTRSWATVITIGVLFGLLIGILAALQGLENVVMKYAQHATDGKVYLASSYKIEEGDNLIRQRAGNYGGEIVELTEQQEAEAGNVLDGLSGPVIVRFDNLDNAYKYGLKADSRELKYNTERYEIREILSTQMAAYRFFRQIEEGWVQPISIALVVVSVFILAFTMAHLIASNTKTFVLYRSIGASRGQLIMIYFAYLIEICVRAVIFAVILAVAIAVILTGVGFRYLSEQLAWYYPLSPTHWPILIGFNWRVVGVIAVMFIAAPVSFLLSLDQFSNKKIAQKLKGD